MKERDDLKAAGKKLVELMDSLKEKHPKANCFKSSVIGNNSDGTIIWGEFKPVEYIK